ncbi:hypothetical protein ABC255_20555 [Neobacillus sp. 3P2-tot-E-2]|uniref:hypothetical protein n=1 Tax=Neobacillus sp. 3P2-tot-E-2 TaxID=3132212 RepID=UPI00399F806D
MKKTDIETINERPFAVIDLAYNIEHKPEKLIVEYNMFLDDSDPSHANYATVKLNGKQQEQVLSYESREIGDWRNKFPFKCKTVFSARINTYFYWL